MKIIFNLLFIIIVLFTFSLKSILAADLDITCDNSGCTPPTNNSIFDSTKLWYPLYSETKTIFVQNSSSDPLLIGLTVNENEHSEYGNLKEVMKMKIVDNNFNNLYENSFANFYKLINYPLTLLLNSGRNVTYSFTASMENVGNDWQEKNTSFDMNLGFDVMPIPGPTNTGALGPTNTPEPASTATPTPQNSIPVLYEGETIYVPVLGAETSITPTPTKTIKETILGIEKKKGSTLGVCSNPWWWWIIYLIQILMQNIFRLKANPKIKKRILFAVLISGILSAFIFWKFFCEFIYTIISGVISILFLYFTHRKTRKLKINN